MALGALADVDLSLHGVDADLELAPLPPLGLGVLAPLAAATEIPDDVAADEPTLERVAQRETQAADDKLTMAGERYVPAPCRRWLAVP